MKCKFCNFVTKPPASVDDDTEIEQLRDHIEGDHPEQTELVQLIIDNGEYDNTYE